MSYPDMLEQMYLTKHAHEAADAWDRIIDAEWERGMTDEQYTAAYVAELEAENRRLAAELDAARALRNTLEDFPWAIPNAMNQVGQDEWFRLTSELTKAFDAYDATRAGKGEE